MFLATAVPSKRMQSDLQGRFLFEPGLLPKVVLFQLCGKRAITCKVLQSDGCLL